MRTTATFREINKSTSISFFNYRIFNFVFVFLFKIGNMRVTVRKAKPKTQKQKNSKALLLGFTVAVNAIFEKRNNIFETRSN